MEGGREREILRNWLRDREAGQVQHLQGRRAGWRPREKLVFQLKFGSWENSSFLAGHQSFS